MATKKYLFTFLLTVMLKVLCGQILTPFYPNSAQDITRGFDSTYLEIQIGFVSSCSNDTVSVSFPSGVSYIINSVVKKSGTASYAIAEANISDLRIPQFVITGVSGAGSITFTVRRKADCGSVLNGKDTIFVKGACGTALENSGTINTYRMRAPSLSLTVPDPNTGGVLNRNIDQITSITNGGNGDEDTIYYFKVHHNNSVINTSATNEIFANGVAFIPVYGIGDTFYYKIFGDTLFGGNKNLTNGEFLYIRENVRILNCQPSSSYGTGWGINDNEICRWVYGSAKPVMNGGVPSLASISRKAINYVDRCTPYDVQFGARNGGAKGIQAACMFNVKLEHGYVYNGIGLVQPYDGSIMEYKSGSINGTVVSTFTNSGNIVIMDLEDLFTIDPDGPGGLDDLDDDGFFDDLPGGDTLFYNLNLEWKCNTTCGQNKVHYDGAKIYYTEMCGDTVYTEPRYANIAVYESSFAGTAYTPANIYGGSPFTLKFGQGHYLNRYLDESSKTRYEWKLVMPSTVSVSGSGNPKYGTDSIGFTQIGDTLFFKSDSNYLENMSIDLVLNCGSGGNFTFYYTLTKIDNDSTNCRCQGNLVCSSVSLTAFCPSPCSLGPVNAIPKVRRTNGCLGWTDNTMKTRQKYTAISDYDLARALYLDTILITGKAYQLSNVANLFLQLNLAKSGSNKKLSPLNIEVQIKRGGKTYNHTQTTFIDNSTGSTQIIDWDLTAAASALPGGTMLTGDSILTISKYVVATNFGLSTHDDQSGGRFFHYSIIAGVERHCVTPVPEMYLVGTSAVDGRNTFSTEGCAINSLGSGGSYLARRFDAAGVVYANEFRPMFYIDSVVMVPPTTYDLITVKNNLGGDTMFPNYINGGSYTYINPGTWKPVGLTKTNAFGGNIFYVFRPKCNTPATSTHEVKIYIKDFYYAFINDSNNYPAQYNYILGSGNGNTASTTLSRTQTIYHRSKDRPKLVVQNLSGDLKGTKGQEHWDIQVRNDGLATAGKTWISVEVPTGSSITVDSVVRLSDNKTLAKNPYGTANAWFPLSEGIGSGVYEVARVFFRFGNCAIDSVKIRTGWDCGSFPSPDPVSDPSSCQSTDITATVIPQPGQIQLGILVQPGNGNRVALCKKDSFEILINSAYDGNVVNPKLQVFMPPGVIIYNPVKVEYPFGSGIYKAATPVIIPNGFEIDLSGTTGAGVNGIPGLIENPGAPGRQLRVILYYTPTCDHISGNPISFKILGESPCGDKAIGNDQFVSTEGINIIGAVTTGAVGMFLELPSDTFKCSSTAKTLTVHGIPLLEPSQKKDAITVNLPQGIIYKGNFVNTLNCTGCSANVSPGLAGSTNVEVELDSGSPINTAIKFSFDIDAEGFGNCGSSEISARAKRYIAPLICASRVCPSSSLFIGSTNKTVIVAKPDMTFTNYQPAASMSNMYPYKYPYTYIYEGTIKNISSVESGDTLKLKTFFDVNQNGIYDAATDSFIKIVNVPGPLAAGASINFSDSFNSLTTPPSPKRPLFSIIDSSNGNCICKLLTSSTFLSALPVEFLDITATNIDNLKAKVTWKTAAEINAQHYELFRSIDGKNYYKIAEQKAIGNSQTITNYLYYDNISNLPNGFIHYKIKQVDMNGAFVWSEMVFINKNIAEPVISLIPNPASTTVTLNIENLANGRSPFTLIDMNGRVILTDYVDIKLASGNKNIDISLLPDGVYIIRGIGFSKKLVVQH